MKIIAQLLLRPNPEQAAALLATTVRANAACDFISAVAWETGTFGKFALQKAVLCWLLSPSGLDSRHPRATRADP